MPSEIEGKKIFEYHSRLAKEGHPEAEYDLTQHLTASEIVIYAATLGPFITAYTTQLGQRLGNVTADAFSRVRLRRRGEKTAEVEVINGNELPSTLIEWHEDLPDQAKLALLELDVQSPEVCGHRLKWNDQTNTWVASGPFTLLLAVALSKRYGASPADWRSRISVYYRAPGKVDLEITIDRKRTIFERAANMSDGEARQALLDLDIKDLEVYGKRLTWDERQAAWIVKRRRGTG